METKRTETSTKFVVEDEKDSGISIRAMLFKHGIMRVQSHNVFYFTQEEFKEFREMIRDFYTKSEQEEHFAMMSQIEPEAV